MSILPRHRGARIALHLLSLIEWTAAAAFLIALGLAVGPGVIVFTGVVTILAAAVGYRHARRLGRLARSDPAAAERLRDKDWTRFGKFYAGIAFLTMGCCIVAIIAIFATHA